ncbi:hypothetical protein HanRHA438_Chr02g0093871 [Helianthus annuus]|nr:hypothetical protein HanRHA438_Chr02g0093871 [Helianthus annuus]
MKLGNTTCFIFLSFPSLNETLEHKIFLLSFCFFSFPSVSKLWNTVLLLTNEIFSCFFFILFNAPIVPNNAPSPLHPF